MCLLILVSLECLSVKERIDLEKRVQITNYGHLTMDDMETAIASLARKSSMLEESLIPSALIMKN